MNQSLHIFRKDVRHLWPELTVYGVLLVCLAIVTPILWNGGAQSNSMLEIFSSLLNVLLPVAWLILITRVVHEESLVGEQQFWTTRPYTWPSLLSAKLLFVVSCILLPLAVLQCFLIWRAGLNLLHEIPALLWSYLFGLLGIVLLFTVVAAVTQTLSRAALSIVAALIVWAGLLTILTGAEGLRMMPPFIFETFRVLVFFLMVGVLLYQYATRDTRRSQAILIVTAVLFYGIYSCCVTTNLGGLVDFTIRHDYPISANPSLRLVFDSSAAGFRNSDSEPTTVRGLRAVNLPVRLDGLDASEHMHDAHAAFTIDAPGYRYTSPWRPVAIEDNGLRLLLPPDVFDRVHATDIRIHLSLIAQRLVPRTPQIVTASSRFIVPGDGICSLNTDPPGGNIVCRYAIQNTETTRVLGTVASQPCGDPGPTHRDAAAMRFLNKTLSSPVVEESVQLGGIVCPGTPLTFVAYRPADNFRVEADLPALSLDRYAGR